MPQDSDHDVLEDAIAALGDTFQTVTQASTNLKNSLESVQNGISAADGVLSDFGKKLSTQLSGAFKTLVFEGGRLSDVLRNVAVSMTASTYHDAMNPIQDGINKIIQDGITKILPFSDGGVQRSGRVSAFARGGVVDQPTYFPMRGGTGLMGEAGPEAIMPLARGVDGTLGVVAGGAGNQSINVTMNISTPDVSGFAQSRAQIAANLGRAIARGQRNS